MKNNLDLTSGSISKQLTLLIFPIIICGLFNQLYNVVDAIIVGRNIGSDALAVIGGSSSNLITMFNGISGGIITGCMIMLSQSFGARNKQEIKRNINTAISISILGGLLLNMMYFFFSKNILSFLNVPNNILYSSGLFLSIYSFSFIPAFIFNCCVALLRGMGEIKRPTIFLVSSFALNIVFDIFFIIILKVGLLGVPFANICSTIISCTLILNIFKKNYELNLLNLFKCTKFENALHILKLGIPTGITSLFYTFTNLYVQSTINLFGSDTIAAYAIANKIETLFWITMSGLGIAMSTFVAQNYGAKQYDRIRRFVRSGFIFSLIFTMFMSISIYMFRDILVSSFTSTLAVKQIALAIITFLYPFYFTFVAIEIFSQTIKGLGNAIGPTYISLFGICGFRFFWVLFYASKTNDILRVVSSFPISWALTSLMFIGYYAYYQYKVMK